MPAALRDSTFQSRSRVLGRVLINREIHSRGTSDVRYPVLFGNQTGHRLRSGKVDARLYLCLTLEDLPFAEELSSRLNPLFDDREAVAPNG